MYLLPIREDNLGLRVLADKGLLLRQALEGKNIMSSIILPAFEMFRKKIHAPHLDNPKQLDFLCVIIGCSVWGPLYSLAGVGGACHVAQILALETLQFSDFCSISHLPHVSLVFCVGRDGRAQKCLAKAPAAILPGSAVSQLAGSSFQESSFSTCQTDRAIPAQITDRIAGKRESR